MNDPSDIEPAPLTLTGVLERYWELYGTTWTRLTFEDGKLVAEPIDPAEIYPDLEALASSDEKG